MAASSIRMRFKTPQLALLALTLAASAAGFSQTARAADLQSGATSGLALQSPAARDARVHPPTAPALALPVLLAAAAAPSAEPARGTNGAGSSAGTESAGSPTYLRDVLPILMGKCSRCHNSEARFVYNWLDYKTAYHDRWEIRRRIWDSWKGSYYKEAMPIQNSPESLNITEAERMKIRDWVIAGAPRGVPAVFTGVRSKTERIELGGKLFNSICAACHQASGLGIPSVFPPLAGSDFLNADKDRAIKTVINGRQGEIFVNGRKFNNTMPAFPLTDDDIANVLTFVYNSFGNVGMEVTTAEVTKLRAQGPEAGTAPSQKPSIYE